MSLQDIYQRHLTGPSEATLAPNASIHYLPSLTSINNVAPILKHFSTQDRVLKKKENFLNFIENGRILFAEVETTITFEENGGAYLPGLDGNFLADKVVSLPIMHVVSFDTSNKIQQIRLMWDQACLLKMVDVIGSRSKNWPIVDGKDQIRVISSSIEAATVGERVGRRNSRVGANGDKYTSLSLSKPHEIIREESPTRQASPKKSAKPPMRDQLDLFAAGADHPEEERVMSPVKENRNPLKAGAGKNFPENRLFDVEEQVQGEPEKGIRTNPQKYNHFDFGEPDAFGAMRPISGTAKKHQSQWDFADFSTPQPVRTKNLPNNERHFGWSDDEEEAQKTPVHRPYVPKPRPDADNHFEIADAPIKSLETDPNKNSSAATSMPSEKMPLGNITNQAGYHKKPISQFVESEPGPKELGINIQGDGMGNRRLKPGEKSWWEYDE